jgi:hypothetical protein
MKPETMRAIGLSVMIVLVVAAWSIVIVVALHVSQIVLNTLDMIVDLAAISP